MVSDSCVVMLPQTAFRLWGISDDSSTNVILVKQPLRHPNDSLFQNAITRINTLIVNHCNLDISSTLDSQSKMDIKTNSGIIDCNVLNLAHHFPGMKLPVRPNILDYSSIGHRSLLYSDLRYTKEFMRATIRNRRFYKRFEPSSIIHWDDYAKHRKSQLVSFGWKNEFIDTSRMQRASQLFLKNHKNEFSELMELDLDEKTLIVSPHVLDSFDQLILNLKNQIGSSVKFAEIFFSSSNIIVKRHRLSNEYFPDEGILFEKKIIIANTAITRLLPIEVLVLGMKNTFLYSVPSSAAFSFRHEVLIQESNLKKNDFSEYGLMLRRNKVSLDSVSTS
jgi:hypothetical protein